MRVDDRVRALGSWNRSLALDIRSMAEGGALVDNRTNLPTVR
jgi:hypothetical protein